MNRLAMEPGNMTGELAMRLRINTKLGVRKDMKEGLQRSLDHYIQLMILAWVGNSGSGKKMSGLIGLKAMSLLYMI